MNSPFAGYEEFCRSQRVLSTSAFGAGCTFDVISSLFDKILSKFGQQQLVMVNYEGGFNQSETGNILNEK